MTPRGLRCRSPFVTIELAIEVTKRCNYRCRHCFVDAGAPRAHELATDELAGLVEALVACGARRIGWSGGEPLIRKDLEQVMALGSIRGIRFGAATNGYLADRQRLRAMQESGLDVLQVSLDGCTSRRATRYRQGPKDGFERAVRAIEEGVALGLRTYVAALLTPDTASEVVDMITFADSLGATGLRYSGWLPVGRAAGQRYDEVAWGRAEFRDFFDAVEHMRTTRFQVLVDCPTGPHPARDPFRCSVGRRSAYITADGDLYPCTALMFPKFRVGNVRRTPVDQLLFSSRFYAVERSLTGSLPAGECSDCARSVRCRGGCPGKVFAAYGSLDGEAGRYGQPACLWRLHGQRSQAGSLDGPGRGNSPQSDAPPRSGHER